MSKNVLVIAAHPDDEILGCGGVMARHVENGDLVCVLIVCEGITSRKEKKLTECDKKEMEKLYISSRKAQKAIGYNKLEILHLPDNRLDSMNMLDVVKEIEKRVTENCIEIVYTHNGTDVNIDHQIIYEATITACRPLPESRIKKIICYEVASSSEWRPPNGGNKEQFTPNMYVDIERYWDKKFQALKCYSSEMRAWPHPRSLKGVKIMAENRGIQVGKKKAEAFSIVREVDE